MPRELFREVVSPGARVQDGLALHHAPVGGRARADCRGGRHRAADGHRRDAVAPLRRPRLHSRGTAARAAAAADATRSHDDGANAGRQSRSRADRSARRNRSRTSSARRRRLHGGGIPSFGPPPPAGSGRRRYRPQYRNAHSAATSGAAEAGPSRRRHPRTGQAEARPAGLSADRHQRAHRRTPSSSMR